MAVAPGVAWRPAGAAVAGGIGVAVSAPTPMMAPHGPESRAAAAPGASDRRREQRHNGERTKAKSPA